MRKISEACIMPVLLIATVDRNRFAYRVPTMRVICLVSTALTVFSATAAADWPQFRGPDRSGHSNETGLPREWSAGRNIIWRTPLPGPGSSSPIVHGERVYVTCYSGYG